MAFALVDRIPWWPQKCWPPKSSIRKCVSKLMNKNETSESKLYSDAFAYIRSPDSVESLGWSIYMEYNDDVCLLWQINDQRMNRRSLRTFIGSIYRRSTHLDNRSYTISCFQLWGLNPIFCSMFVILKTIRFFRISRMYELPLF